MGLLQKIFGTHSENELKRIRSTVDAVMAMDEDMKKLSDSELRNKRIRAHKCFDAIWKQGIMTRGQTYQWMQHKFGLSKDQAHIGYFSDYLCLQLIEACNEVLENTKERGAAL